MSREHVQVVSEIGEDQTMSHTYLELLQQLGLVPRVGDKLPGVVVEAVEISKDDPQYVYVTYSVMHPIHYVRHIINMEGETK